MSLATLVSRFNLASRASRSGLRARVASNGKGVETRPRNADAFTPTPLPTFIAALANMENAVFQPGPTLRARAVMASGQSIYRS